LDQNPKTDSGIKDNYKLNGRFKELTVALQGHLCKTLLALNALLSQCSRATSGTGSAPGQTELNYAMPIGMKDELQRREYK
jgi:hypothetical protein